MPTNRQSNILGIVMTTSDLRVIGFKVTDKICDHHIIDSKSTTLTIILNYAWANFQLMKEELGSFNSETQSAARLNRIINVSFGPSYKNGGGSSSTLPHTRTLPCALPVSGTGLRTGHDSMHGRGGSLREEIQRHGSPTGQRMDLVYVTERIISLAFPPDLDGSAYTVHLREVAHMLSSKHGDNFRDSRLSQTNEWKISLLSSSLPSTVLYSSSTPRAVRLTPSQNVAALRTNSQLSCCDPLSIYWIRSDSRA
ncbi:hypothetical protein FHG87_003873 [Trinorchestia longiramus]|nr:hypothetical protein FHG87_003873 [Trinorchestia longiramus]